jgi:hypothetical protein
VSPGERLDKRWRVENIGSCNWDASFSVRLIAGPELGMLTDQALSRQRLSSNHSCPVHSAFRTRHLSQRLAGTRSLGQLLRRSFLYRDHCGKP